MKEKGLKNKSECLRTSCLDKANTNKPILTSSRVIEVK